MTRLLHRTATVLLVWSPYITALMILNSESKLDSHDWDVV